MLKSYSSQVREIARTASLGSALVVEADVTLRQSRVLLLSTLSIPVQTATGYCDVCNLPVGICFSLIVISLNPDQGEAEKIAEYARRVWPVAKILLLGGLTGDFADPLYDDVVDPRFDPLALVNTSRRLLKDLGANLSGRHESH
jgi:hypothetical protein